jgi:hypothetical protein
MFEPFFLLPAQLELGVFIRNAHGHMISQSL